MRKKTFLFFFLLTTAYLPFAQTVSRVWVADNGNGKYTNPVLNADYSDPDVIRVGDDYYLVSSSFSDMPGLPILHSKDLVNWKIIGHALKRQPPFEHFAIPRHGDGVWAPALRYHNGEFYLYYPDPDYGIYLVKTKKPAGPWSDPVLVQSGKGLIDPCPFWDEKGEAYLVHAWAGSRAGIKSIITVKKMNSEGTRVLDEGAIVYDGHELDPTIEGPKIYKRHDYYYIFAPAGGVSTGWQLILRARNIYGPYERRVVMDQGGSNVNGPHQGAWVNTQKGEDWFLHFQDKGAYGRVVHLQPMKWINDWPVIGVDADGDGKGEPVLTHKKPDVGKTWPIQTPAESDEFNNISLGLQWQWQANAKGTWSFLNTNTGNLRLYAAMMPDNTINLWQVPNLLLQKIPAEQCMMTAKLNFKPNTRIENEKAGLLVMGTSYASLAVRHKKDGDYLVFTLCKDAAKGKKESETVLAKLTTATLYLRVRILPGAVCRFSYSLDDKSYVSCGDDFTAEAGRWIGAKVGLYCTGNEPTNDAGYADVDWFHVDPVE